MTIAKNLLVSIVILIASASCGAKDTSSNEISKQDNRKLQAFSQTIDPVLAGTILDKEERFLELLQEVLVNEELIVLVDKKNGLAADYVPNDLIKLADFSARLNLSRNDHSLRLSAAQALNALNEAALKAGVNLLISSTYRSFTYQNTVFTRHVRNMGQKEAERVSAKPGTSQHQLGTVVDFGSITEDFAYTKAGKWLFENAARHGWSLSYPEGAEDLTGYMWEPWHYRYIGIAACQLQKEFFADSQQLMLLFLHDNREELFNLIHDLAVPSIQKREQN